MAFRGSRNPACLFRGGNPVASRGPRGRLKASCTPWTLPGPPEAARGFPGASLGLPRPPGASRGFPGPSRGSPGASPGPPAVQALLLGSLSGALETFLGALFRVNLGAFVGALLGLFRGLIGGLIKGLIKDLIRGLARCLI